MTLSRTLDPKRGTEGLTGIVCCAGPENLPQHHPREVGEDSGVYTRQGQEGLYEKVSSLFQPGGFCQMLDLFYYIVNVKGRH